MFSHYEPWRKCICPLSWQHYIIVIGLEYNIFTGDGILIHRLHCRTQIMHYKSHIVYEDFDIYFFPTHPALGFCVHTSRGTPSCIHFSCTRQSCNYARECSGPDWQVRSFEPRPTGGAYLLNAGTLWGIPCSCVNCIELCLTSVQQEILSKISHYPPRNI